MAFSYTITMGSPRAYVAALLATSFAATEPGERDDVAALNKVTAAPDPVLVHPHGPLFARCEAVR